MTRSQKRTFNQLLIFLIILVLMLTIALLVRRRLEANAPGESSDASLQETVPAGAAVSTVSWKSGDTHLSFSLGTGGTWYWDGDDDFPLDSSILEKATAPLYPFAPVKTIASGDALSAYGLNENSPSMTVGFQDGTQVQLTFGSQVPSSEYYYMLRSDETSTVYVMESALPELMSNAVYDMMVLPEIPTMNTMHSIYMHCAGKELLVTSEDGTTWLCDGQDITKNEAFTALVSRLTYMELAKCENFKPSADGLALWGMETPSVTLQVHYDDEQLLMLEIGHKTLDGDGYYVRMNNDTTIYSISSYNIDPILSVAQNGFAAPADTQG